MRYRKGELYYYEKSKEIHGSLSYSRIGGLSGSLQRGLRQHVWFSFVRRKWFCSFSRRRASEFCLLQYSNSMDPITNVNSSWCFLRYGVGECLFRFDENVVVEEALCDSYETEDYITWVLHIRDGVQFSNGNEVTASGVKASLERVYEAEANGTGNSTPSQYVTFSSIEADDAAGTVTLVCDSQTVNLPGILAYPWYGIVDTSVIDTEVIGTGPYRVSSIAENSTVELVKNEYYWDGEGSLRFHHHLSDRGQHDKGYGSEERRCGSGGEYHYGQRSGGTGS